MCQNYWIWNSLKFSGLSEDSFCIGLARVGCDDENIVACSLKKMTEVDLGAPLHCMVIAAPTLHPLELEYVEQFRLWVTFSKLSLYKFLIPIYFWLFSYEKMFSNSFK